MMNPNNKLSLRIFAISLLLLATAICAQAQTNNSKDAGIGYFLNNPQVSFNKDVPTPFQVLGFNLGEQFPDWNDVLIYMRALRDSSPRVSIKEFGKSNENRRFIQVTITSPQNQKRIEEIRQAHLALCSSNFSGTTSGSNTGKSISSNSNGAGNNSGSNGAGSDAKLVVDLMASIHGNEASGVGAALVAAYYYAACTDPQVEKMLEEMVIVITPGLNPDGINKFASWVNNTRSFHPVANLDSREFSETWPSGRSNHYWADCNRDWLSVQHPEGQNSVDMYLEWMPNVVVDIHEQGNTQKGFYFSPGDANRTYENTPQKNQDLTMKIAQGTARALDQKGTLYFSKEGYDDFFIGKGAAYGDILGSICILHEQGSSRGFVRPTQNGLLTYKRTICNQSVAAMSVVESAWKMKDELIEYQHNFYKDIKSKAAASKVKALEFTAPNNGIAYHMLEVLLRHRIDVYRSGKDEKAFIIPMEQEKFYTIKALFDNITNFADSTFYDVSTWTFTHAFDLKIKELTSTATLGEKVVAFNEKSVKGVTVGEKSGNAVAATKNGESGFHASNLLKGEMIGGTSPIAYAFECDEFYAPSLIEKLLKAKLVVRVAKKSFTYKYDNIEKKFAPGTIIVPVNNQLPMGSEAVSEYTPSNAEMGGVLRFTIEQLAKQMGVKVYALQTGLMAEHDLGSSIFGNITAPKVAIITGRGMSVSQSGEIWRHLDLVYNFTHAAIDYSSLASADLSKFNVIVLADGTPTGLTPKGYLEKLERWVAGGGTLIVTGKAYALTNKMKTGGDSYLTDIKPVYHRGVEGVILKADFTKEGPLSWGRKSLTVPIYKMVGTTYQSKEGTILMRYNKDPYLSGCISKEHLRDIAGAPSAMLFTHGNGRAIFFADDMIWRSYWYGSSRVLTNAILFREMLK